MLVYKDAAASLSYACHGGVDDAKLPAGVGYCWSDANRPDWFLTDTTGARIEFCDFAGAWQMDVGDASYQQTWLANVLADLRSAPVGRRDARRREPVRDLAPVRTHDRAVSDGRRVHRRERELPRATSAPPCAPRGSWRCRTSRSTTGGRRADWPAGIAGSPYSSGAVQEYFSKWGRDDSRWLTDDGTHNDWSGRQALFARTQAAGKTFIGVTYAPSDDVRSMRYARASFLLDWNGGPSALAFEPTTPEAQDPYFADWTTDIGAPTGARVRAGVAWKRVFANGIVVLDPSPSTSQSVRLGGNYVLPNGGSDRRSRSGRPGGRPAGGVRAAALLPAGDAPPAPEQAARVARKAGRSFSARR